MNKPHILWLADIPGWAYASIVQQESTRLTQYQHGVFYVMKDGGPSHWTYEQKRTFTVLQVESDIIVAMYLFYLQLIIPIFRGKVITMLTGARPFEKEP